MSDGALRFAVTRTRADWFDGLLLASFHRGSTRFVLIAMTLIALCLAALLYSDDPMMFRVAMLVVLPACGLAGGIGGLLLMIFWGVADVAKVPGGLGLASFVLAPTGLSIETEASNGTSAWSVFRSAFESKRR